MPRENEINKRLRGVDHKDIVPRHTFSKKFFHLLKDLLVEELLNLMDSLPTDILFSKFSIYLPLARHKPLNGTQLLRAFANLYLVSLQSLTLSFLIIFPYFFLLQLFPFLFFELLPFAVH